MQHDVFISYSSKDKPAADAACNVLERNGIRCWIAPRDIVGGKSWAEAIVAAIKSSKVLLLVFSKQSNKSQQVAREVERAISAGIPVIPFRIEDVVPSESMEYYLSTPHWLNAFPPPMEQHFEQLTLTVKNLLGEPVGGGPSIRPDPPEGADPSIWKRPGLLWGLGGLAVAGALTVAAIVSVPALRPAVCDMAAQNAETDATRVNAFRYIAAESSDPAANIRDWTRPEDNLWVERSPKSVAYFRTVGRVHVGRCDGTVVSKEEEPKLELLISDKDCEARKLMFRRRPSCDWNFLPPMEQVE
ncbi:toll/interleukin-1 receptor domain-containing protein [Methylobacterium haplocladii]|nr:toll/interleukin-1 receptor domain-containing protein [Methylobacterium haplocladii]